MPLQPSRPRLRPGTSRPIQTSIPPPILHVLNRMTREATMRNRLKHRLHDDSTLDRRRRRIFVVPRAMARRRNRHAAAPDQRHVGFEPQPAERQRPRGDTQAEHGDDDHGHQREAAGGDLGDGGFFGASVRDAVGDREEDALRDEPVEDAGEGHGRDGDLVGELEEAGASLLAGGARDAEGFAAGGEGVPFAAEEHGGEEGVEVEVDDREHELGQVGDEDQGDDLGIDRREIRYRPIGNQCLANNGAEPYLLESGTR